MDELYSKIKYGDATAEDILEGKTALVQGEEVVGTGGNKTILIGEYTGGQTIDLSNINGYQELTVDNFLIEIVSMPFTSASNNSQYGVADGFTPKKTYTSSTGILKTSEMGQYIRSTPNNDASGGSSSFQSMTYKIYIKF